MPWTSLAQRVSDLPLVIAGPILRRVEAHSVSVWIACKEKVLGLRLAVYGNENRLLNTSEPFDTVQLGERLHVQVLTAEWDLSAANETTPGLTPGSTYSYDILFPGIGGLGSKGVLNGPRSQSGAINKIAYGNKDLPSFVAPPRDINDLHIVHGSCRKPHGGFTDAFRALAFILESTHDSSPPKRPQQLILHGDQIYADDVADVLLFMLCDAAAALLGWDETHSLSGSIGNDELKVGQRQALITKIHFSSEEAKSHLVLLGEFYSMYLFVWSPELWPEVLPDFADVFPNTPRRLAADRQGGDGIERDSPKYTDFLNETRAVEEFKNTLPLVRRILANISSYMIFDDHEVTDDWFIEKAWCEDAIGGPISKRIIQNGLAAFAVFQMWGNTPEQFKSGQVGGILLKNLQSVHKNLGTTTADWEEIGKLIVPQVHNSSVGAVTWLEGSFRWNFNIRFPAHQLIVLDTRTRREFVANRPPILVGSSSFDQQLPDSAGATVTVLVSAAPVIGNALIEETGQPILARIGGPTYADLEAWVCNQEGLQNLLARLQQYGRVVILSGDVHYSFSSSIEYRNWQMRLEGGAPGPTAIVQLCSSSLKNATNLTCNLGLACDWELVLDRTLEYAGWQHPGEHVLVMYIPTIASGLPLVVAQNVRGRPAVYKVENNFHEFATAPEWRYKVTLSNDPRLPTERGLSEALSQLRHPRQASAFEHLRRRDVDSHRIVVGWDNIGSIRFEFGETQAVLHELWFTPKAETARGFLLPYTQHRVPFGVSNVSES